VRASRRAVPAAAQETDALTNADEVRAALMRLDAWAAFSEAWSAADEDTSGN